MLRILMIIFICAVVSASSTRTRHEGCPSGHTKIIKNCIEPIRRLQLHPTQNVRQMCSTMNTGLDCLEDILERCANQPDVAAMASMMDIEQMRYLISSQCSGAPAPILQPGTNSNCPSGYSERILECVGPMQNIGPVTAHNIDQACGVVISGLACLDNILENCAGEPEVQAITRVLNINTMRDMVHTRCSALVPNNVSTCSRKDKQELEGCVRKVQRYATETPMQCSKVSSALDCLSTMMEKCSSVMKPRLVSRVNALQHILTESCSRGTPNGCGVSNPADEIQRCNGYLTSFQSDSDSMQEECRSLFEGFDCFRNLIRSCPNDVDVVAFTSMVDIETARESMSAYCPSRRL